MKWNEMKYIIFQALYKYKFLFIFWFSCISKTKDDKLSAKKVINDKFLLV